MKELVVCTNTCTICNSGLKVNHHTLLSNNLHLGVEELLVCTSSRTIDNNELRINRHTLRETPPEACSMP